MNPGYERHCHLRTPSPLPLSFSLSLSVVGCQLPSVTLQKSCFFSFLSTSVATSLNLGSFSQYDGGCTVFQPHHQSDPFEPQIFCHWFTITPGTSPNASEGHTRPFTCGPRTRLQHPSSHVLSELLELFFTRLLLPLGMTSLPFYLEGLVRVLSTSSSDGPSM